MAPFNFLTLLGYIDRFEVPIYDLDTDIECNFSERPLGVGRTMKVYKAHLKKGDKKIKLAAKVTYQQLLLHTPNYKIYEMLDSLRQEIRIMQHLTDHPNIIDFYGMSFNELKPIIFIELSIGSLQHYLEDMKDEGNPVSWTAKAAFCCDVADGLHALHAVDVVHGDIKADNVLLFPISEDDEEQNLVAKISDFGYSATTASIDKNCGTHGTRNFYAPECTSGAPHEMQLLKDSPKKDNYAFGLFVWQVSKDGEIPYASFEDMDIQKIKHEDKDLDILLKLLPSDTPEEFRIVILKTTRYQPSDRATLSSVKRILIKLFNGNAAIFREIQKKKKEKFINNAIELPKVSKTEISSIKYMRIPSTIKRKIYSDFEKAASKKNSEAAFLLSICYKEGFGVNIDVNKAVEWLIKAAEYGSLEAMIKVVNEFDIKELPMDPEITFPWYTKAAHAGSLIAQFKVSVCYYIGVGVDKDITKGDFWISKCGSEGLVCSLKAMGLYENDKGFVLDSTLFFLLTVCDEIDSTIGYTPILLNENTRNNQANKIKALITDLGIDAFVLKKERPISIHRAAMGGYIGIVKYYTSIQGVDVNTQDCDGSTPLHRAALNGHIDTAKLLAKLGANVNTKDNDGLTPLHKAALNEHISMVKLLVTELGADVNSKDNKGWTPLHEAALNERISMAKLLVTKLGADVNSENYDGLTPLHKATLNGHMSMAKLLVTKLGADVNSKDFNGLTPLHKATLNGHMNMAKLLVTELGADVNSKDNRGWTPIHEIASNGHISMAKLLVTELGADVNSKNNRGWTPIHKAALNWDVNMAKLLVAELGTGVIIKKRLTLLHKFLVAELGACVNIKKEKRFTPLHGSLKWDVNRIKDFINQLDKNVSIEDFIFLIEYLKQCTDLNLGGFERDIIHIDGVCFLANGLKLNIALTTLNLSDNMIGSLGAHHLAEALKQNTTLTNLNLEKNDIGDYGAYLLAETLRLNTALNILNLGDNRICDEGAYDLVKALKQNTTLTNLDLRGNRIDTKNNDLLLEIREQNTCVVVLE